MDAKRSFPCRLLVRNLLVFVRFVAAIFFVHSLLPRSQKFFSRSNSKNNYYIKFIYSEKVMLLKCSIGKNFQICLHNLKVSFNLSLWSMSSHFLLISPSTDLLIDNACAVIFSSALSSNVCLGENCFSKSLESKKNFRTSD